MPRKLHISTMVRKLEERMDRFIQRHGAGQYERFGLIRAISQITFLYEQEIRRLEQLLVTNGLSPKDGKPIPLENRFVNMTTLFK